MTSEQKTDLLVDLARLLKKYGPETFESLAQDMASAEWREKLLILLRSTAEAARSIQDASPRKRPRSNPTELRTELVELRKTDAVRGNLLLDLLDTLLAKQVLPTAREIRRFAEEMALTLGTTNERVRAACLLVMVLRDAPLERWQFKVECLLQSKDEGDRSLAGWSRIIHDPTLRHKKAE